jgi:hypothetical protein
VLYFKLDWMLANLDSPEAAMIEGARIGVNLWMALRRDLHGWVVRKN